MLDREQTKVPSDNQITVALNELAEINVLFEYRALAGSIHLL